MTTRNCLLALTLASVAVWIGCARGLKHIATVTVASNPANQSIIATSLTVDYVATIDGAASTAVVWTLSSNSCSGAACGTITPTAQGATYTAPNSLPSGKKSISVAVTATSNSDAAATAQATITVLPVTVCLAPPPIASSANVCATNVPTNVGAGLTQQFAAVTIPDNAPQTFTWSVSCTQGGAACGAIVQDANTPGLAVYTAPATPPTGVTVTATSTLDPASPSSASSSVTVLKSRVSGAYSFRFSGYDASQHRVLMAGTLTFTNAGAVISGGVVDVINGPGAASPGPHRYTITSGGYSPSALADNSTNDAGALTFTDTSTVTHTFQAVITSAGEVRLIEDDANGSGSGVMQQPFVPAQFNKSAEKFAFLLNGVDSIGKRIAWVGLLPIDGNATSLAAGAISGAMVDVNDGGASNSSQISGSYGPVSGNFFPVTVGLGGVTWHFDAFVGAGQTNNGKDPLTLYAISTDAIDSVHPALAGTLAFQDPSVTYDKTALNSSAVSHLDGLDSGGTKTSAVLLVGKGDGNGNIQASFDANNAGTLPANTLFTCTYTAGTGGRYVVNLLGNSSSCGGTPLPFVFFASGANRGFLMDQSSTQVLVGAMDPQGTNLGGTFAGSTLPGTYSVSTVGDAVSAVSPLAANILLTYNINSGTRTFNAAATLYDANNPGGLLVPTGSFTINSDGTGTISLTPQGAANPDKFLFYAVDVAHFWMIQTQDTIGNAPTDPAVMIVQQ